MTTYIIRRLLWGVVLLILVSALTFLFFNVFPAADPAVLRAGRNSSPATIAYIRHELGLDQADLHPVLGVHEEHRAALQLRLQLLLGRLGARA